MLLVSFGVLKLVLSGGAPFGRTAATAGSTSSAPT
jgi:hypothetical protein